jgi:hypothetical protein
VASAAREGFHLRDSADRCASLTARVFRVVDSSPTSASSVELTTLRQTLLTPTKSGSRDGLTASSRASRSSPSSAVRFIAGGAMRLGRGYRYHSQPGVTAREGLRGPWHPEGMGVEMFGQQSGELVPQRVNDKRWQGRHRRAPRTPSDPFLRIPTALDQARTRNRRWSRAGRRRPTPAHQVST